MNKQINYKKIINPVSGGLDGKESACNAGDLGGIPGSGRPLKEGMATPSSILAWKIPMERGAWWATVHGVTESNTTERLSTALLISISVVLVIAKIGKCLGVLKLWCV